MFHTSIGLNVIPYANPTKDGNVKIIPVSVAFSTTDVQFPCMTQISDLFSWKISLTQAECNLIGMFRAQLKRFLEPLPVRYYVQNGSFFMIDFEGKSHLNESKFDPTISVAALQILDQG